MRSWAVRRGHRCDAALMDALDVGATSGADMVTGMIAGSQRGSTSTRGVHASSADGVAELECAPG